MRIMSEYGRKCLICFENDAYICAIRMSTVSYICTYVFVCLFVCLHVIYLPAEYIVEAHTDREQDRRVTEREAEGCQRKGMLLLLLL